MAKFLGFVLFTFVSLSRSQFFDPILDDKSYLDNLGLDVEAEVADASAVLLREARIAERVTRDYIGSKLKDNVFKALRVLAEQEMSKMGESSKLRPLERQDSEEGTAGGSDEMSAAEAGSGEGTGSGGGGEAEEPATTELTGLGTAVKINQNVFKFLGDTFKIIFKGLGGKAKKHEMQYVDEAASLMSEPFADQLLGLVGLMANETQAMASPQKLAGKVDHSGVYNALFHRGLARSQSKFTSVFAQGDRVSGDIWSRLKNVRDLRFYFSNDQATKGDRTVLFVYVKCHLDHMVHDLQESDNFIPDLSRFNVDGFVANFRKSVGEAKNPLMSLDLYRGVRESYKFLDSMALLEEKIRDS